MIENLIEKHTLAKIAQKLGESPQTINNWRKRRIPFDRVRDFCEAVDYEITPHQLAPKQYPLPQDGLPSHLREVA